MKDLRNDFGKTYTVSSEITLIKNYGFAMIDLDTTAKHLDSSLQRIQQLMADDLVGGQLGAEKVADAKALYVSDFMSWDGSAKQLISFAEDIEFFSNRFGQDESPYAFINSISPDEYIVTLRRLFASDRIYSFSERDHLYFEGEFFVLLLVCLGVSWHILKLKFRGRFDHAKIQYIRKIVQPPLWLNHIVALFLGWIIFRHINGIVEYLVIAVPFLRGSLFLNYYASGFSFCFIISSSWALVNCAIPSKLMIVGDHLVIKSMSFYSYKIPLNEIIRARDVRMPAYPLSSFEVIKAVKLRCYFPLVFQLNRLLILSADGRAYLFAIRDSSVASEDINRILEVRRNQCQHELAA